MSSTDPTSSSGKKYDYDKPVTITFTAKEWFDLTRVIGELTMGDYAPDTKGWEWLQEVMGVADRQTIIDLSNHIIKACNQNLMNG